MLSSCQTFNAIKALAKKRISTPWMETLSPKQVESIKRDWLFYAPCTWLLDLDRRAAIQFMYEEDLLGYFFGARDDYLEARHWEVTFAVTRLSLVTSVNHDLFNTFIARLFNNSFSTDVIVQDFRLTREKPRIFY